ncbi:hypothetical protein ARC20_03335 [Stenotrophomonas panacihumi]|uniref:Uncharacterized protein n=1 Tax=Stenotrophomonas panacihumi TaxID=676599 RepID=A0A0R0AZZ7_9GAMM|nr:hypothetical protein [Stenotrophomonas panacihumi]KRG47374.1 hypothetical protein ARC20_03335 [Stenotrophomonas panacihumi]PTN55852.1 hypothetical protein C9J98_04575 [Stenotrophomonas panacihumi]
MALANPRWIDSDGAGQPALSDYAEDLLTFAYASLAAMPNLLAEVELPEEDLRLATLALSASDLLPSGCARFAEIWRAARDAKIARLVEELRDEAGLSELEAVQRLQVVYA